MGDRKPWGQLIPTQDGRYVQLYEDGSSTVYDQQFNVVSDDTSPNPMRAALARAGREREAANDAIYSKASAEETRRWEKNYTQKSGEINNTYQLALRNAKSNEERNAATRWYNEQQVQLSKGRLAFDRETQQQEFGLKQANLGYNLLSTAASLRGPANYFQASNYARGVANNGGSTFLSALQNNTRLAGYGAQQAAPEGETLGTLTAKLGGTYQSGTGGTTNASGQSATAAATGQGGNVAANSDNALLNQTHAIGAQGAHKLTGGSLEQLSPTEYSLLMNGMETTDENGKAYDVDTFLDQYRRSRVGQSLSGSRAA